MNIELLVKKFNKINGTRYQTSATSIQEIFEGVKEYGEDLLDEIIESTPSSSIYSIINENFVASYKEIKELKAQVNQTNQVKQDIKKAEEQSNLSLGLIEKALAKVMIDEYAPQLAEGIKQSVMEFVQENYGSITRKIEYQIPQSNKVIKDITHEKFETILKFVMANEPVMLVGPAGTGKNVICKQIANALNLDFYFTNSVTQEYKLTGFIDANGVYQETEFYKAFKNGGLFMLDEIDASIPEVLVILNAAIANRYFEFPNGKIYAHDDFRIVAAGNTFGNGASYTYTGRSQLDGASLDRFAIIEVDYSPTIENALTQDKDLLAFLREFRRVCNENSINHIVSYRSITRLDKLRDAMDKDELLKACLLKNLEQDDLRIILNDIKVSSNNEWKGALEQCVR